ncbi:MULTISPECIES: amidohydrolase family protein [Pseudomonas]|uniref:Amidohydrolase family protein n=1 Tax=Pseudomonas piscis TaxID=2614538 RepID=U7A317_9PSED|nr:MULTISPECIES: amidohydrolase family protein [Pseudomonas]AZC20545.1 Amidohydrolase family protein [Pseudomonas sp. CMR5c]ERO64019.1 amidohydrolase [Pseudomonas piscis]MQA55176.1 amidohydrolase family protein [Pseudomonas piscis]POA59199.1 amidohydrolase [Pseudomonas sp. FW507-12TSA]
MTVKLGAIDAWAQPANGRARALLPEVARLFEKSGSAHLLDQPVSIEQTVALMDQAGVEKLMLSAWCRPEGWVFSNDEVAAYTRAFPERFVGVATVDLSRPMAALAELDRAVGELGCKALRIVPWLWKLPPNHRLYYPLYAKCIELGIPFCTQVGHTGPLMPSETGRPVPYLDEVALDFPELVIVGGHIGHPWTDEMIGLAWKHDNIHIDTSAYLPAYYPPQLLHFIRTYGQDKVLFGSNFPQLSLKKCLEQVQALELPPPIADKFLQGNARRVFGL